MRHIIKSRFHTQYTDIESRSNLKRRTSSYLYNVNVLKHKQRNIVIESASCGTNVIYYTNDLHLHGKTFLMNFPRHEQEHRR